MKFIKKITILITPLLLFAGLLIPYSLINSHFIVDWLGCGCPIVDEVGNIVENKFCANDFTALFWLFIAVCATVLSAFLSKKAFKKVWIRIFYIIAILLVSLFTAYRFYNMMMWN